MRKLLATEMKSNTNIKLPPLLINRVESEIHVRKEVFMEIFKNFIETETNEAKQKNEISKEQSKGLRKLVKKSNRRYYPCCKNRQNWKVCCYGD